MTRTLSARLRRPARGRSAVAVEILVCGSPDRGDDGAPIAASALVRGRLAPDVTMRVVGQLDVDDLLSIPAGAGVVIVDAATGVEPGEIVDLALTGLIGQPDAIHPRSSHALALPEVVGLAEMMRGRPLCGRIVAIGGAHFGFGHPISPRVAKALSTLSETILDAVDQVRPGDEAGRASSAPPRS